MGMDVSELKVPVKRLKRQGKLKTVGTSQSTRYFPVQLPDGEMSQA
jgi:predicted transcriptional regulator